ncbi:MAG: DUF2817 domain-containing protein [Burkholderiales bacterium]
MSTGDFELFSEDYSTARLRFSAAANALGADLSQLNLGLKAPDDRPLSIDIAWLGTSSPARVVIHSCGLHGVEGFAGSAIQLALMGQSNSIPADGAVLFVHALNPFGMAWLRRCNENNIDLNRNFFAAGAERPATSEAYRRLETFLNPRSPPGADLYYARAAYFTLRYGLGPMKQAIAEGQYEFPQGLFFGGMQLELGPALYQSWLASRLESIDRGFAIDVHTGLGRSGEESLFLRGSQASGPTLGAELGRQFSSDAAEEGVGYHVRGDYARCFDALAKPARMHVVTQEFGTYPSLQVLYALRQENRWHHYGDGALAHPAKLRLKEVFAPVARAWREAVVGQGVSFAKTVMRYMFR